MKAQGCWTQPEGQAPAPTTGPVASKSISREPSSLEGLSKSGIASQIWTIMKTARRTRSQGRSAEVFGAYTLACAQPRMCSARMAPCGCRVVLTDRGPQAKAKEIGRTYNQRPSHGATYADGVITASRCDVGAGKDTSRCHRFVCVSVCVCVAVRTCSRACARACVCVCVVAPSKQYLQYHRSVIPTKSAIFPFGENWTTGKR